MLPAPPSSCAGWWFAQLWRALLAERLGQHGGWQIVYPSAGQVQLYSSGQVPHIETVAGSLQEDVQRHCILAWQWPGEDGMLHALHTSWQVGEMIVRPLEWERVRQPFPKAGALSAEVPWPYRVRIRVHGWHAQLLERADLTASDEHGVYLVRWEAPHGEPRLPVTDLPCALTTLERRGDRETAALVLAGLTLPWRIDVDRDAWSVWRRVMANELLRGLGGARGSCPRHGPNCPWPDTGQSP